MRAETLALLRCPYCGSRVALDTGRFHQREDARVHDGVLRCYCSEFPIVSGVAVMTVEGMAEIAREHIERGDPVSARRAIFGLDDDEAGERFDAICTSPSGTYEDAVEALGPEFAENRYFLYRFSDPTFLVADAVVRSLGALVLGGGGRAVDLCGGSGHLTRALQRVSTAPPVLMDWTFTKLWLARSFTAPGAEFVCADAHAPLPFAPRAFGLAVCSDAFHYIWSKALLAHEMLRIIDDAGAAALTHAHNARQDNPSAGMPLPPEGYRDVFEGIETRVYSERSLLADVLDGHLDLSASHERDRLEEDPALTTVATTRADVFADHTLSDDNRTARPGGWRLNPLYDVTRAGTRATLTLRFPSDDYAREYGACLRYLPDLLTIDAAVLDALERGDPHPELHDLAARRIVLDLPDRYL